MRHGDFVMRRRDDMEIFIRVDANQSIGYGHLMRCVSLADGFQLLGHIATFISDELTVRQYLLGRDYKVATTDALDRIDDERKRIIILDGYHFTNELITQYSQTFVLSVFFDDFLDEKKNVDGIINTAVTTDYELPYAVKFKYFGAQFVLLRQEMIRVLKKYKPKALNSVTKNVLVTTGGTDHHGILTWLPMLLKQNFKFSKINLLCGGGREAKKRLETLYASDDNIQCYVDVDAEMVAELMANSDFAISSGGSTLYELAAFGVPTMVIKTAQNQERLIAQFVENKAVYDLGLAEILKEKRIIDVVGQLYENANMRQELSKRMSQLVNEEGAFLLAERIILDYNMKIEECNEK